MIFYFEDREVLGVNLTLEGAWKRFNGIKQSNDCIGFRVIEMPIDNPVNLKDYWCDHHGYVMHLPEGELGYQNITRK